MSNFSIAYQFKAMTGQFQKNVRRMKTDMKGLHEQLKKQNIQAKKLAKNFSKVGKSLTMYVTAPLLVAGTAAVLTGGKFEDALASLEAITGLKGSALASMKTQIMATSETFGISATNIAKGMELIGSKQPALLKTPKLLLEVTRSASTLAKAAGQELPQAADNLLSIMNAFSLSGDKANEVINVLAASSKFGAAQIPYLSEALKRTAAGASLAKLSLSETAAVMEVLAEKTGLPANTIGIGFQNVLLKLEASTNKNLRPSVVGLTVALKNLGAQGLSTAKLTKMFGTENIKMIVPLINNIDAIKELNKKIVGTSVAQEQAAIRMKTFNQTIARLWVSIKNNLIRVFDILKPSLVSFAKTFTSISKTVAGFTKRNPELTKFLIKFGVLLAVLGPALIILSKIITAFIAIKGALLGIGIVAKGLLGASIFGGLLPLVGLIGAAFAGWGIGKLIGEIPIVDKALNAWFGYATGATAEAKRAQNLKTMAKARDELIPLLKAQAKAQGFTGSLSKVFLAPKTMAEVEGLKQQLKAGSFNLASTAGQTAQQVQGKIVIETRDPQGVIKDVSMKEIAKDANLGISMAERAIFGSL